MLASRARTLFSRSFATASGKGVRITQFGDWSSSLAQVEVPVAAPAAGQVSVKFQAAPINPADLDVIAGTYGKLPKLPHFAGLEGVAVVDAVGAGAKLKVGQRVIPAHPGFGTWRSHAVAEESAFLPVASDIPIEYSAVLSVNPCSAYVDSVCSKPHFSYILTSKPGTACSRTSFRSKPATSSCRTPPTAWSGRLSSSCAS
jgi:threonine dehydrogenase-like Zn-dependent dehydrogenase